MLTTEQLSEQIQVPARTLANWRYRSEGPAFVKVGGSVRYNETDVDRWLAARRVDTTGAA